MATIPLGREPDTVSLLGLVPGYPYVAALTVRTPDPLPVGVEIALVFPATRPGETEIVWAATITGQSVRWERSVADVEALLDARSDRSPMQLRYTDGAFPLPWALGWTPNVH